MYLEADLEGNLDLQLSSKCREKSQIVANRLLHNI